ERACELLAVLAEAGGPAAAAELSACSAAEVTVACLAHFGRRADVAAAGCWALEALGRLGGECAQETAREAGAAEALLHALVEHRGSAEVEDAACRGLRAALRGGGGAPEGAAEAVAGLLDGALALKRGRNMQWAYPVR
ncbi:unnamed protein product, partial [Prorocentrum cordatum]